MTRKNNVVLILLLLVAFLIPFPQIKISSATLACPIVTPSSIIPYLAPPVHIPIINVTMHVTNDEDTGLVGYWALENYNKTIQVWQFPNGSYVALVLYSGTWNTYAGALSPEHGIDQPVNASGIMMGGYVATFNNTSLAAIKPIIGDIGTYDYLGTKADVLLGKYSNGQTGATGKVDWTSFYFAPHPPNNFNQGLWGWAYALNGQEWCNSKAVNSGEIWTYGLLLSTSLSTVVSFTSSTSSILFSSWFIETLTTTTTSTSTSVSNSVSVSVSNTVTTFTQLTPTYTGTTSVFLISKTSTTTLQSSSVQVSTSTSTTSTTTTTKITATQNQNQTANNSTRPFEISYPVLVIVIAAIAGVGGLLYVVMRRRHSGHE
jgi:hypothetical protein